ncbi:MAG: hypothetical protein KKD77_22695 [Gammaproteobacteria bacterium]|nr:hypothetical protein [Gammaproteobacteria bacterium]
MHQLYSLIEEVDKTHPALGNALAFAVNCVKAKKCLLIVSPAGCGKSAISDTLGINHPGAVRLDSVTRSGLKDFRDTFSNYYGLVVMDDMGKVDSLYNRKHTISTFAELCYSHFISKHTFTVTIEIANFFGSAVLNIQPPILAEVYEYPEWESVIQDKTIRYYHLYRPTKPNESKPSVDIDWGIDIDLVSKPTHHYKLYSKLESIASIQWSDARVIEHLNSLLRATAALDKRQEVRNEDFILLTNLMKPLTIERHIMTKVGFEIGRYMNTNLAATLVEFASWKNISIDRIARDYKISPATTYRLLSEIKEWFKADAVVAKKLIPKPELKKILKEAGVER